MSLLSTEKRRLKFYSSSRIVYSVRILAEYPFTASNLAPISLPMKNPISFTMTATWKMVLLLSLLFIPNLCWCESFAENQIVAAVIIREAGGEGENGMLAVAGVIRNRSAKSGRTPYYVVTKPKQFDGYGRFVKSVIDEDEYVKSTLTHPRWAYALFLADTLNKGECQDITGGSTHFYSGSKQPYWAKIFSYKLTIGRHYFYSEKS